MHLNTTYEEGKTQDELEYDQILDCRGLKFTGPKKYMLG